MCCFFFFKQKTAYEVRISDWSSDGALPICSRRMVPRAVRNVGRIGLRAAGTTRAPAAKQGRRHPRRRNNPLGSYQPRLRAALHRAPQVPAARNRKSVVEGKTVYVRVDLGCRRKTKKKKDLNIKAYIT